MNLSPRRLCTALCGPGILLCGTLLALTPMVGEATQSDLPLDQQTGEQLYLAACANCHGGSGSGAPASLLGFDYPVPDFSDCSFASREPTADWVAIAHEGGPVRGFSELMPAFGGILNPEQLERIIDYIRGFCSDHRWPPGEFNLPKALVTEKAYLEDETLLLTAINTEGDGAVISKIIYEKRFGARNQFEAVIPFGWWESATAGGSEDGSHWTSGIGDIALGLKRAIYDNLGRGTMLSLTGEFKLPTGDEHGGLGKGTTVFEPFLTWGQILPAGLFLQSQAGFEIPFDNDKADNEAFLRLTFGGSLSSGDYGRTWSPMVEVLAWRDLVSGADVHLDAVPQIQITLNTRQHIMMNIGVRTPIDDTSARDTQILVYLLWDWFDGGLLEGW